MVTWAADGTMAGYDPVTKRLKNGLYHFASPGTVDLNAITRLNYPMGAGLSKTTYPNILHLEAPLTFTSADFSANPGRSLSVGMMLVRSDKFPAGHVPTPAEIFARTDFDWAQRASWHANNSGPSTPAYTHTYVCDPDTTLMGGFYYSTKWWVLLYPSAILNTGGSWSHTNDAPIKGSNINSVARVLSFWSNHTPGKPTITSPINGSIALAGTEFTLTLNPADADETPPEDAPKYNDDVNGVHFQYRPTPTADTPNPDWADLPYDWTIPEFNGTTFRDGAWMIRGSRYWNGLPGTANHEALIANLGCKVRAGAPDTYSTYVAGKGALPTGSWQIRGRTFDYGHPYPNSGTKVTEPGPCGINSATRAWNEPLKDTYPPGNTSPWSDPVTINIPSQVPPPLITGPRNSEAVSGNTIRLGWNYRNTHQPPRDQYMRTVQIRKVGDLTWSTVFSGLGSNSYIDLPAALVHSPLPPLQVFPDPSFEAGTNPFTDPSTVTPLTITNQTDASKAHSGSRYIEILNAPGVARANTYDDDFSPAGFYIDGVPLDYTSFVFDGWFYVDATQPVVVNLSAGWVDSSGSGIYNESGTGDLLDSPYVVYFSSRFVTGPAQWRRVSDLVPDINGVDAPYGLLGADASRLSLVRPPNGVRLSYSINVTQAHSDAAHLPPLIPELRFDDGSVIATVTPLDDFTLEPGTQYEWRVQATDTDGIISGYSAPAQFWYVPAGASGTVRAIPSGTIDGATLGIGTHRVEVYRRGGIERVGELTNLTHVDWSRVRDDISTAQVVVSGWDIDGGNLLAKLQTWAYEVVIYRDNGYSVERVWEGPISQLTYERDKVTIDAKDVMNYAYRRILKQAMDDSAGNGTTVVNRGQRVLQNAFAPDDPNLLAYLQVIVNSDDTVQYRSTPAWTRTAFEEVDDMASNAGLDYTVAGRSIILWDGSHRIGTLPEFRDEDLGSAPIVSEYGMSMANVYSVTDGNGVHGEATRLNVSGNDPTYGLVEMLSSTWASNPAGDSGTYTQSGLDTVVASFRDAASWAISDRYPPPVIVRLPADTSLSPDLVLSIQSLVPGVVIPLRSTGTLRTVVSAQKLDSMKVVEESGKETISITLSPFSNDAASIVSGGA